MAIGASGCLKKIARIQMGAARSKHANYGAASELCRSEDVMYLVDSHRRKGQAEEVVEDDGLCWGAWPDEILSSLLVPRSSCRGTVDSRFD
ncbi:hypothetical protein POX_a00209 [Penicillium oxalicum]|uniref:hypothetical protein n=1 Tax=Penicillium oxalicum TaxID=69781 RepID=UPI0020B7C7DD|nr:hypothetical protein POX_a00209 [Penicillium oxalicum]KAI2793627.1 hypothetical protein POX_a00209 [Penicillium oxalicum]